MKRRHTEGPALQPIKLNNDDDVTDNTWMNSLRHISQCVLEQCVLHCNYYTLTVGNHGNHLVLECHSSCYPLTLEHWPYELYGF